MALKMKVPTVKETILTDLDPDGEAKIAFRQATARENQIRDTLIFGSQRRSFTDEGLEIRDGVPWSVRQEIECRLTMCGAEGILGPAGAPLFRFKNGRLDMSDVEFQNAWGKINPISICDRFHELCHEVNPDWGFGQGSDDENPPSVAESD
jgi:hypothetical protein